jgi:hypothetical protein
MIVNVFRFLGGRLERMNWSRGRNSVRSDTIIEAISQKIARAMQYELRSLWRCDATVKNAILGSDCDISLVAAEPYERGDPATRLNLLPFSQPTPRTPFRDNPRSWLVHAAPHFSA